MDDKETQKTPLLDQKDQWVIEMLRVILRISKQGQQQLAPGFDIIIKLRYLGIFLKSWNFETKNDQFEIHNVKTTTILPSGGKL